MSVRVTRGYGIFEGFLSRQRARMADRLIPQGHRAGRILDVGCGTHPFFLINTECYEKHGLDKVIHDEQVEDQTIHTKNYDIEREDTLPYENNFFDVVTMLAILEHLEPIRVVQILKEIRRIMKPGGIYIITTPARWTDGLLKIMARLRLLSPDEIDEHKDVYSHDKLVSLLEEVGFEKEKMRFGFFEFSMNLWLVAIK